MDNTTTQQVSQRAGNFRGGIPLGLSATTVESRGLEIALNTAVADPRVQDLAKEKELSYVKGLTGDQIAKALGITTSSLRMAGIKPDGGIFLSKDGVPVLSTEAKKQGKIGNAIERSAKNLTILRATNPDCINLLFARGEGFFDGNSAQVIMHTLYSAINVDRISGKTLTEDAIWNSHGGTNLRLYRFPEDTFESTAVETIREAILTAMKEV